MGGARDAAPGRLLPWFAVAYGAGVVLYFTAEREPAWLGGAGARRICVRQSLSCGAPQQRRLSAGAGLCRGRDRLCRRDAAHRVDRPSGAAPPAWSVAVTGFVEAREERERNDRIVVRTHTIEGRRLDPAPQRVRVAVRSGTAPAVGVIRRVQGGSVAAARAAAAGRLRFRARHVFFAASAPPATCSAGSTTEAPPVGEPAPGCATPRPSRACAMRIDKRIRAVIPGRRGRDRLGADHRQARRPITPAVKDAFYVSSLAHVLAIAGFHMAVVTGIVFFFVRGGLALIPSLASRRPIKKWAAAGAFAAATFYLVLSGAGIATQRAFVMVAIVLVGVMVDRPALTFRTLSFAAFAVLTLGAAGAS